MTRSFETGANSIARIWSCRRADSSKSVGKSPRKLKRAFVIQMCRVTKAVIRQFHPAPIQYHNIWETPQLVQVPGKAFRVFKVGETRRMHGRYNEDKGALGRAPYHVVEETILLRKGAEPKAGFQPLSDSLVQAYGKLDRPDGQPIQAVVK